MKVKRFFAGMAKSAFAFAAVLTMSFALTACSGSDEDAGTGATNPTTEVPKEAEAQSILLDGVKKTVIRATLSDRSDGNYRLRLYLSDNPQDVLDIFGNTTRHNGKTIDLAKEDGKVNELYEWGIAWKDNGTDRFLTDGASHSRLFTTGTMKITVDLKTGDYDVTIDNGKVQIEKGTYNDGAEHTVAAKYKGKAEVYNDNDGGGETTAHTILLDGVKKTVARAELTNRSGGDYTLNLFLSDNPQDVLSIGGNTTRHSGKTIDLTKVEENTAVDEWGIAWIDNKIARFVTNGNTASMLFKTGTMKVTVDPKTGDYDVTIDNGKVQMKKGIFSDGATHTVAVKYKGKATVVNNNNGGGTTDQTILLDGVKKTVTSATLTIRSAGNYVLRLFLSDNPKDVLQISGNTARYNNKALDLTKVEEDKASYEWEVSWQDKGKYRFGAIGNIASWLFKTGTMRVTVDPQTGDYDVTIDNGKIHHTANDKNDGAEHSVSVKWKGKAEVPNNTGGIASQIIWLDGVKKTVTRAELSNRSAGNYTLRLYLSDNPKDYLQIVGNTTRYNGKTIDLTKEEIDTMDEEWGIAWQDKGTPRFTVYSGHFTKQFDTGTMKITVDLKTGDYEITINSARVHQNTLSMSDGQEHTVLLKWKGKAEVK